MLKDLALQEHTGLMKYDQVHISSQNGFLDATCGFYMQLKIKSFIQNAGSGVLAKAAQTV